MKNLSNEIKSLLIVQGLKQSDLTNILGMSSRQSVTNKFSTNSWSVDDLVKVVNFLDGKLIIKVDNREIEITKEHVKSRKSK